MPNPSSLLHHYLAALAYRTQKTLRGAPAEFGHFQAGQKVRTPIQVVCHMTNVLGYARTYFIGGTFRAEPLETLEAEVRRFHEMLEDLSKHLKAGAPLQGTTPERLLQGPFSDAMTHVGQLATLRRLFGSPVPPEDFIKADIDPGNLGQDQPDPVSPDKEWPEAPMPPPTSGSRQ
jgi:hypothetical protein